MATNRLPAASRKRHDNSTINSEIGARTQAACGSTLTLSMKISLQMLIVISTCFISSCALNSTECSSKCEEYFNSVQTSKQGALKAKSDIIETGYAIYRYDMPGIRTGYWDPYYARFKHFGIKELGGSLGIGPTLEYMNAYNKVMDNGLKQRYGNEYRKYRHKLMPPYGASIYKYSN